MIDLLILTYIPFSVTLKQRIKNSAKSIRKTTKLKESIDLDN